MNFANHTETTCFLIFNKPSLPVLLLHATQWAVGSITLLLEVHETFWFLLSVNILHLRLSIYIILYYSSIKPGIFSKLIHSYLNILSLLLPHLVTHFTHVKLQVHEIVCCLNLIYFKHLLQYFFFFFIYTLNTLIYIFSKFINTIFTLISISLISLIPYLIRFFCSKLLDLLRMFFSRTFLSFTISIYFIINKYIILSWSISVLQNCWFNVVYFSFT